MTRNKDVECPYCEKWQEICHDDGFGYAEDENHVQECSDCGMTFIFTTSISFHYESEKAPCKNGEAHDLQPITGIPPEFFEGKQRCAYCGDEVTDKAIHEDAMKRYFERTS
jgi:DNA-directed RNA polymerase subunit RPC12/RpoP